MKMTLPKEWYQSKLPDEEGHEIGAGCPAVPLFGGWQPIASAPRDGTKIDVWLAKAHCRVTNCYWVRPQHTCGENEGYCDSCPDHDGWVDGEDFMYGYTKEQPTHWMPVPLPPPNSKLTGDSPVQR